MSSKESLHAAVSTIEKQTPFINLLVANSGYLGTVTNVVPRPTEQTVGELQTELWNKTTLEDASKVLDTNIAGSYFTFLAFLGLLGAGNTHPDSLGKSGLLQSQFISTSSVAGFFRAESPSYIYDASKAALVHLTKILSSEFAKHSIRANSIAPGMFVTEMIEVCDREMKALLTIEQQLTWSRRTPQTKISASSAPCLGKLFPLHEQAQKRYANTSVSIDRMLTFMQGYGRCYTLLGI